MSNVNVRSCFEVVSSVIRALEEVFDKEKEPWKNTWKRIVL